MAATAPAPKIIKKKPTSAASIKKNAESAAIADKYKKLDAREHVLTRPGMYIGSIEEDTYDTWVFDIESKKMIKKQIKYIPGFFKIFDEILVNAIDHSIRLKCEKAHKDKDKDNTDTDKNKEINLVKNIKISIDKETGIFEVTNDGDGIEVVKHPEHDIYIPELIFGNMLTSTNYDDTQEKIIGGTNGVGSKITSVFSTFFEVETIDHTRKLHYIQKFETNMSITNPPKITKCTKKPYTTIRFKPDYERFNMKSGLTDDMYSIIIKRVYDACAVTDNDVNIHFNGEKLDIKTFEKYVDLFIGAKDDHNRVYEKINDRWEIVASYNDFNGFEQVSFVNGIWTIRGGKHVEFILNQIVKKLSDLINKKNKNVTIKPQSIKDNLILFVKSTITNPTFDSQSKETLTTPSTKFGGGTKAEVSDKFIEKLYKSGIVEKILELSQMHDTKTLQKTDGKKRNIIRGLPKLEDANWAGTNKSNECVLVLTEGDSAATMAIAGISEVGRERYGVFPLRGKVLNVQDTNVKKISDNEEITNIKKILGLETKEYKNIDDLRYGSIMLLTDSDSVVGDTPILLKKNGKISIETIENIGINWNKNPNGKEYGESDYEIWTDNGWTKIVHIMKHKTTKRIFRVLTHTGIVDVTEDHSLLNIKGEKITPANCNINDELLHKFPRFKENNIEIPDNLEKYNARDIQKLASSYKIQHTQYKKKHELIDLLNNIKKESVENLDIKIDISPEEAFVMGLFWADGTCGIYKWQCTQKRKDRPRAYTFNRTAYSWGITNCDYNLLTKTLNILQSIDKYKNIRFGIVEDRTNSKKGHLLAYKLIANGGIKISNLLDIYCSFYYKTSTSKYQNGNKIIPSFILNSPKDIREKFLEGYYCGDGRTHDISNKSLTMDIESKISAQSIYFLCKSLGYEVSINHKYSKPNVYTLNITKGYQQDNPNRIKKIWDLGISEQYVYDLETENHHFQAGIGQIILHNTDGSHIKGLLFNLFNTMWPSLLKMNVFVTSMLTPIVKVKKQSQMMSFYSLTDFENWHNEHKNESGWNIKYYKGLGTSDAKEAKEYFKEMKRVKYIWNDKPSEECLDLAFNKKRADDRKDWLSKYDRQNILDYTISEVTYEDFVHKDLIHFSNYDIERSIPNMLDGLKISQRKVLFGCFKRNLTDKEMKVAQLASYVSEVSAYHHGETSLQSTIIGMAQNFVGANNINLLQPHGQFGCLDPDTEILMWNSQIKPAKDIKIGDVLVGDDGKPRNVLSITSGEDNMYRIDMKKGGYYTVNSEHILTLKFIGHKQIYWRPSDKSWKVSYFDNKDFKIKEKMIRTTDSTNNNHFNASKLSKEEAFNQMKDFVDSLEFPAIFDIKISQFLSLPKYVQRKISCVKNSNCIEWKTQHIEMDPYILGIWLGDGNSNGTGITSADIEVIQEYCMYLDKISCELVHDVNNKHEDGSIHENYHFTVRKKGYGFKTAIGDEDHCYNNCIGCKTSGKKHSSCDWKFKKQDVNYEHFKGIANNGMVRNDMNPWKETLKKINLFNNKHIPNNYIFNDRKTRLELLAGLVDTDGTVKYHDKKNKTSPFIEISQSKRLREHVILDISKLCNSLGYTTTIYQKKYNKTTKKGEDMTDSIVRISGNNLHEIPMRVERKKIKEFNYQKDVYIADFKITHLGIGKFCGWSVDSNERFLLGDFTITHNSRRHGGKDASQPRYIFTLLSELTPKIFIKDDLNILSYINDDGIFVEPYYYIPIIPMILVNGALGIGTGFSTNIPCYNPKDIINILIRIIDGEDVANITDLVPWYRGFNGKIEKIGDKYYSRGKFTKVNTTKIEITELPIGTWTFDFKCTLEEMLDKFPNDFKSYENNSGDETVNFTIQFTSSSVLDNYMKIETNGFSKLENTLKLYTSKPLGTTNMYAFNEKGAIQKYDSPLHIISVFYTVRLDHYQKRKDYILDKLKYDLELLENKIRFIRAVVNEEIIVHKMKKNELEQLLLTQNYKKHNDSYDYIIRIPVYNLTIDKVEDLEAEFSKSQNQYDELLTKNIKDIWKEELINLNNSIETPTSPPIIKKKTVKKFDS